MLDNTFNKKESPLVGMMGGGPGGPLGISGGSASDPTYVEDVFSTFVYDGTGSAQTITNGIDLSGEGGLVWAKVRNSTINHHLVDTERGGSKYIRSSQSAAEGTDTNMITSFNSDGFTIGSSVYFSQSPRPYTTWTFRKASGFFDVVTYAGTGSAHSISHSLGSVPGMILYKAIDDSREWMVYHRSLGASQAVALNLDNAAFSTSDFGSGPTSTQFSVGSGAVNNTSGKNYIAYLFAHDDQSFGTDSDESIIKCGSYTGSGSSPTTVTLGFEPQWVMIKRTTGGGGDWVMYDNIRGCVDSNQGDQQLIANSTAAETNENRINFEATGFRLENDAAPTNHSGQTYVYMAIRRPFKPPTAGTEVFAIDNQGTGTMPPQYHSNFVVDWAFVVAFAESSSYRDRDAFTRLLGRTNLSLNLQAQEANYSSVGFDYMNGYHDNNSSVSTTYSWMFKRAPGFFDVVAYAGNSSSNRTISHNLNSAPEMMFVKLRSTSNSWIVYHKAAGATHYLLLNADSDATDDSSAWNDTDPTSSVFTVGSGFGVNENNQELVAYLFASLDGISKVGSYTGTGSNINVDCGFTGGARFVMIKRSDASGGWYVWDSTRGISSGNDPYFLLNTNDTEVTNTDYIDPLNAGFTVTSSAPSALNANGGTYIFLAIA